MKLNFISELKQIVYGRHIPCVWSKTDNWGDALCPWLLEQISGLPARFEGNGRCSKLMAIGSVLHYADNFTTVWGSGLIEHDRLPEKKPHKVTAVRGKYTRNSLIKAGIDSPRIYGDPALLLPLFYQANIQKKYKIGLIPHYVDIDSEWINSIANEDNVLLVDVRQGVKSFIDSVLSCEAILSSSLHGLICADAYNIPNRRIVLSNKVIGGDFKFLDYYSCYALTGGDPIYPKIGQSALSLFKDVYPPHEFKRSSDLMEQWPLNHK